MNVEGCNEFQILISADFDGELDERELIELKQHLTVCPSCRSWQSTCQQLGVDLTAVATSQIEADLVGSVASDPWVNGTCHHAFETDVATSDFNVRKPEAKSHAKPNGSGRWFLGIAALLLVAIGVSFGVFSRRNTAVASENFEPLAAMHAINLQTEQDQLATLRAVQMELRMMKLEMKQSKMDPAVREQMETRLESLLSKTRQLDASTQVLYQGEKP